MKNAMDAADYYNEFDPYAAKWIGNLIEAGELSPGRIDTRSITDVQASDLAGYRQCHFFAGIGGWPFALRLAEWPDAPVWTGSCPCQPLSCAGKRRGELDDRHLWPTWFKLIRECRPATIFGEQVASNDGLEWLAGVRLDLEGEGYAFGAADLCAASAGAPGIRQRIWWVAHAGCEALRGEGFGTNGETPCGVQGTNGKRKRVRSDAGAGGAAVDCGLGNPPELAERDGQRGLGPEIGRSQEATGAGWSDFQILNCTDGKSRRIERVSFPLAYGLPRSVGPGSTREQRMELMAAKANRVGRLRGYGNAIVPQVAAMFVRAFMESVGIVTAPQPRSTP